MIRLYKWKTIYKNAKRDREKRKKYEEPENESNENI